MNKTSYSLGVSIGVVNQIENNRTLCFIANNELRCNIGDVVALHKKDKSFVLGQISKIELDFYLDNPKQFFISKAVDNDLQKLTKSDHKPRFGQHISAIILGHYEYSDNDYLIESENTVNRYTPYIFQEVYLLEDHSKVLEIFGLCKKNSRENDSLAARTICLGELAFPVSILNNQKISLHFNAKKFSIHTLITGVTGSGKSRLAALLVKELASIGAHISILDPHDEYAQLLTPSKAYEVFKFGRSLNDKAANTKHVNYMPISFFENDITAYTLTKLLPSLSSQQEEKIYEIFNELNVKKFLTCNFINRLMDELNEEIRNKYPQKLTELSNLDTEAKRYAQNDSDFTEKFINGVSKLIDRGKPTKASLLITLILKINELKKNNLISIIKPNWLAESPNSIDIINIDYSTNEYVRRLINAVIHYFLRWNNKDQFRAIIVDEAHMLLAENSITSQLVMQLLREARKFNLSIIFISQNQSDIPVEIRNQFQNQFCFRESKVESTKYFADRMCQVTLYGSKTDFVMRVNNMPK